MPQRVVVVRNPERRVFTWLAIGPAPALVVPVIWGGGEGLAFAAAGAICVLLGVRAGRCAVRAGTDGVEVVNFARTRRVSWDEVRGFELTPTLLDPERPSVVLESGERIRLTGLESVRKLLRDSAPQEQVAQLDEILETVRRTGVPWQPDRAV